MSKKSQEIIYIDRKNGQQHKEVVMGDAFIRFAYQTMAGKAMFPLVFGNGLLSRLLGWYFDSGISKGKIKPAINDLGICEDEFERPTESFKSFNDFFCRKLKPSTRPFDASPDKLLSPADGRILVYNNCIENFRIKVKGCNDTVSNLFGKSMHEFNGGKTAVIRLCPADYHRYHFPCDGLVIDQGKIKGKYHSVNPVALDAENNIFCMNKREYTILDTNFGKVAFLEVGAFGVGGIIQTHTSSNVTKMQEKGYFKFGGSTIVLLFQKDRINFCSDLSKNSSKGYETLIKVGNTIAEKK